MALPSSRPLPFGGPTHGQTRRLWLLASEPVYARASAVLAGHQNPAYRAASHQARSNRNYRLSPRGCLQRRYARLISRTPQLPSTVARGHTDPDRHPRSANAHAFAAFLPALQPGSCINPAHYKGGSITPHYRRAFGPSPDAMIAEPAAFVEGGARIMTRDKSTLPDGQASASPNI